MLIYLTNFEPFCAKNLDHSLEASSLLPDLPQRKHLIGGS